MKLGALSYLLCCLALVSAISLFGHAIYSENRTLALGCLSLFGLTAVLFIVYRTMASGARCPLCRASVLTGSGASRNRNARRFLGSYRLRVARDIVLKNSFVCPYCNEATRCTVKPRPGQGGSAR